ncbi:BZIP transcription factor [Phytophthora palmivora]|uniref:BZIP transcription factor n=1 Tax=Phytophthora palmivora TaxID=4796 RepID=A0A2P4XD46_9STRA|nr:BZIP transcription factor [Phytophthora palmivora]
MASFLCPPNTHSLSDNVIGGVVQRVSSFHGRYGMTDREATRFTNPRQTYSSYPVDSYSTGRVAVDRLPSSNVVGQKPLPNLESLADMATKRTKKMSHNTEEDHEMSPTGGRKMKVSAARRERCRINQARYRKRQRQHEEELDNAIRKVQDQIDDLESQRQNILRCAPTNESVWVVATEYFRLFRYGYMTPMMAPEPSTTTTTDKRERNTKQSHVQLEYLRATMAPDVTDGNVCGVEALLENWKGFSLCHDDVHFQLKRLEQINEDCLLAVTATRVTITENTLRQVYPHLVDANGVGCSPLAMKLLNQRLVIPGSVRFDWDSTCGRVMRVESNMDVMAPMLELLGSLENVASVFEKATMSLEGRITRKETISTVDN